MLCKEREIIVKFLTTHSHWRSRLDKIECDLEIAAQMFAQLFVIVVTNLHKISLLRVMSAEVDC